MAAGAGVAVEISRGPVPVSVPRLTGLKLEDALAALFDAGLAAAPIDRVNDSEIPRGVIGQQDPPPNARVPPGSDVAIVVSGGPRAVIQVDPPLIPAGGSATVSVEVRDVEGAPLDPQPDVTLALDVDPDELFGTFPTLTGNTIDTGIDTQGAFASRQASLPAASRRFETHTPRPCCRRSATGRAARCIPNLPGSLSSSMA